MLPICQVCLRTDRKLQTLENSLANFHDELCDFAIEDYAQFCSECSHMLRKFHNFKEKCVCATKVLKNWKAQKAKSRKPLNQLSDGISAYHLTPGTRNNQKVYIYQADNTPTPAPRVSNQTPPKYPYFTINIAIGKENNDQSFDYEHFEHDTVIEADVKLEQDDQKDNESNIADTIIFEELNVKNDIDSNLDVNVNDDSNLDVNDDSESIDFDIKQLLNDAVLKSDTDSSDYESLKVKKRKITLANEGDSDNGKRGKKVKKRVRNKKPFNIELLKSMLISIFEGSGDVRDEEGTVIDKDCILNSLDKMHVYTLNQIKNRISGSAILNTEAIQVLSRVQKKYGNQYSSVFTIEHLPTKEQEMAEFAKRKDYEGYVMSEHKCEMCYRGFKHRKLLEYHVKMYHDPAQPHFCAVCQMRFKNRHALLKHRNGHRAVYKCKLCPLVTNYRTAMVNHYHQHKGVIYTCELCKGTYKSKSCLSAHMNCMHQSQYICSLCARTFASDSGLAQHRIRKHADEVMIESADSKACEQCNVTFITEAVFQKHLEKSHAEKKSDIYVYKKRNYVAPRQKPKFVCRVCSVVEHSIGRLTWHFKRDHPTESYDVLYSDVHKHLCHVCGKGYASITDLNEHKHLHTGARPYACDKCPKAFHRKTNLRSHLERHLPPARECQQCGKKFVSAANLNNHMKMHIGVRHYTCEICSKSFLHRSALNAHVRGVHHHIRRARKPALKCTD